MIKPGTVLKGIFPVTDIVEKPVSGEIIGKGESQLLFGETFIFEAQSGDWICGTSGIDGYRGYVRRECLGKNENRAGYFVSSLSALVYPKPDFKSRPILNLSFLSRLSISPESLQGGFLWAENTGWIPAAHVLPIAEMQAGADIIATAKLFINAPYRYGGRLAWGIDCSGLVQLAVLRNGISCPRDSAQQALSAGKEIDLDERRCGDLVFFKGHAGILTGSDEVLNASARTMGVCAEPLAELERHYGGIISIRRTGKRCGQ